MQIISPLDHPHWDNLLESHPAGSFFHTTNWARVLTDSYGYRPRYFAVLAHGAIHALIPVMEIDSILTGRRGVSLPFSDYSVPFAADTEQYRILIEQVLQFGAKARWKSFEIRGGICPWQENKMSAQFYGHRLDLGKSEEELFSRLRTNMQRNVKKAVKSGVTVDFLNSVDAVDAFWRLNCITRKEHGIPPQPRAFFRKIHEHVLSRNMGLVVLASYRGRFVAGGVFFQFGGKAIYKYGVSNHEGKTSRANNLVMWEAIKRYRNEGYSELCFGRTECENAGLRDYKQGYGTEEYVIPYYKYEFGRQSVVEANPSSATSLSRAYRRVPIPLSRAIGNLLYRHIG